MLLINLIKFFLIKNYKKFLIYLGNALKTFCKPEKHENVEALLCEASSGDGGLSCRSKREDLSCRSKREDLSSCRSKREDLSCRSPRLEKC